MHMAADGSRMLGLSLPLELLLMGEGPSVTLQDIYRALDTRYNVALSNSNTIPCNNFVPHHQHQAPGSHPTCR